jgi:hypothetical protein
MGIIIEIYTGEDSKDYIDILSKLRIDAFKEYPYLYDGEFEYEKNYVHGYVTNKMGMIAIAKVDGNLAGVSTGIPLISESEIVSDAQKVFSQNNINIEDYYYYGEIIILPQFRGRGITTMLYSAQDNLVRQWGFKHVCILTVVRENDHPLKPNNYKSPDDIWKRLGFFKNNLTTNYHWPTIQADKSVIDTKNTLEFWIKPLQQKINHVLIRSSFNKI